MLGNDARFDALHQPLQFAEMVGVEVEISATGQDDRRTHKDVLEREINGRPAYTAVFDKIRQGSYTLWVEDVACERDVFVSGGAISELDWSVRPLLASSVGSASTRTEGSAPPPTMT